MLSGLEGKSNNRTKAHDDGRVTGSAASQLSNLLRGWRALRATPACFQMSSTVYYYSFYKYTLKTHIICILISSSFLND
jgi:hypothetical protein